MKHLLWLALVCLPRIASAWDISGVNVSGEASFDYNFLSSGDNAYPGNGGALNDQYRFNQAQLQFKKETDEVSFLARLNYAPAPIATSGGSNRSSIETLDQLEIYYKLSPEWAIGFGRLCSTLGLESIMKSENVFYTNTVSYQAIVPGYGEGLRLRYNPGEWLSANLSTYNQSTNNAYGDDYTPTKTTELSLTGVAGPVTWFGGYYVGADRDVNDATKVTNKKLSDYWLTYKISEAWSLSLAYDDRTENIQGGETHFAQSTQAQLAYAVGRHTLGLRYESLLGAFDLDTLNNSSGVYYPAGANKVNILSVGDKFNLSDNMKLYLEYRKERTDKDVLLDKSGNGKKSLDMITLAIVAHF